MATGTRHKQATKRSQARSTADAAPETPAPTYQGAPPLPYDCPHGATGVLTTLDLATSEGKRWVSETVVHFLICHDIKHAPPEVRKRVYVASPFLFTKITETGNHVPEEEPARTHHIHKEARRQLTSSKKQKVDIFEYDDVIVPITIGPHHTAGHLFNLANIADKTARNAAFLLLLDSLPDADLGHDPDRIARHLDTFFAAEYIHLASVPGTVPYKFCQTHNLKPADLQLEALIPVNGALLLDLPRQENTFDCGLFSAVNTHHVLHNFPEDVSPYTIQTLPNTAARYPGAWGPDSYTPQNAGLRRDDFRRLALRDWLDMSGGQLPATVRKAMTAELAKLDAKPLKYIPPNSTPPQQRQIVFASSKGESRQLAEAAARAQPRTTVSAKRAPPPPSQEPVEPAAARPLRLASQGVAAATEAARMSDSSSTDESDQRPAKHRRVVSESSSGTGSGAGSGCANTGAAAAAAGANEVEDLCSSPVSGRRMSLPKLQLKGSDQDRMQAAILAALHQGNDIGTRQLVLLKEISEALRGGSIQAAKKGSAAKADASLAARAAQTQINIRHQLRNNDMYPSSLDEAVAAACGYVGYKEGLSAIQRVNNDPAASVDYRALIGQPKWTKAARKFRSDLCTAHKGPILDHLGRPDVKDDPLDERGVPKAAVVERLLQRAGAGDGWLRLLYHHADNDKKRTLRGSIVSIACDAWRVEDIELLTAAQMAFTLIIVHHCLTKGTDTPMSTEVTEYNARVALYNGFVAETEKWSTLPVKPVKQAPPVPMFEGVQGKQRKAKGARKAAARSASAKPSDDLHADGADEAMLDTEL